MKKSTAVVYLFLSLALNTAKATEEVTCDGKWTKYFNRDVPTDLGDFETLEQIKYYFPGQVCDQPSAADARIVGTELRYTADSLQSQQIDIGPDIGFKCWNTNEICYDYEVKFCCPEGFDNPRTPRCAGEWTRFFNLDTPDGDGDYETIPSLRCAYPGEICPNPLEIDVRIAATDWDYRDARQVVEVSTLVGLRCDNVDQLCEDYKVRFCCLQKPSCTCAGGNWTRFFDVDDPGDGGDFETLDTLRNLYPNEVCKSQPSGIDVRTVDGEDYTAAKQEVHISLDGGFVCNNTFPIDQECCDYKVRFCCEEEAYDCDGLMPCSNDGTCIPLSSGGYRCLCSEGFTGDDCETVLSDDCDSGPCLNGATCNPLEDGYSCTCAIGFDGDNCEDRDDCALLMPCMNHGTCFSLSPGGYQCLCADGFTGNHCDTVVSDPCEANQCQNDATCVPVSDEEYKCQCPVGFDGDKCEDRNDCELMPCSDEEVCIPDPTGGYECICRDDGLARDDCETDDAQNCWETDKDGVITMRSGERVLCQEGWTVFDRRYDGTQDFYLFWEDYKNGFGSVDSEYWMGLEKLHNKTTKSAPCRLRIDMWNYDDDLIQAEYGNFAVASEKDFYQLTAKDFTGTAGDALSEYHDQMYFTTRDEDHDTYKNKNCAVKHTGGFWYSKCYRFKAHVPWSDKKNGSKMKWNPKGANHEHLRAITMKFRCD